MKFDYRRGLDWWIYLLTTYTTRDSEVQVIKAPSLIYTLYKSLKYVLSLLSLLSLVVSWQRILTMEILQLLWSRRCLLANTPQLNCQISYSAISSQHPLQNSTELIAPTVLVITSRYGPHRKEVLLLRLCPLRRERVYQALAQKRVA
jgi:hypothetical protein